MNKYPAWKYALIGIALVAASLYALPNFFGQSPAVHISALRANKADAALLKQVEGILKDAKLSAVSVTIEGESLRIRTTDDQIQKDVKRVVQEKLGDGYVAALTKISSAPAWLGNWGITPMALGLDLQGGVHFLMQVNMKDADMRRQVKS